MTSTRYWLRWLRGYSLDMARFFALTWGVVTVVLWVSERARQ